MRREQANRSSLLVRGITREIREEDLRYEAQRYGSVRDIYIPLDHYTREVRGIGFVEFYHPEDAEDAKYAMDRMFIRGREISVVFAKMGRKLPDQFRGRRGPPPPYRGGGGYGRYRSPPRRYRSPPRRSSHRRRSYSRSRSVSSRSVSSRGRSYTRSRSRSPISRSRSISSKSRSSFSGRSESRSKSRSSRSVSRSRSTTRSRSVSRGRSRSVRSKSPPGDRKSKHDKSVKEEKQQQSD